MEQCNEELESVVHENKGTHGPKGDGKSFVVSSIQEYALVEEKYRGLDRDNDRVVEQYFSSGDLQEKGHVSIDREDNVGAYLHETSRMFDQDCMAPEAIAGIQDYAY